MTKLVDRIDQVVAAVWKIPCLSVIRHGADDATRSKPSVSTQSIKFSVVFVDDKRLQKEEHAMIAWF